MLKKNKGLMALTSLIILLPMAAGILLWDRLPEVMATHWGTNGEADGWSSRPVAVFGLPLLLLAVHWIGMWVTGLDSRNKTQHPKVLYMMMWLLPAISLLGNGSTYAAALGWEMDLFRYVYLLLGLLFIIIGNYLPKCKQNWFIGIKIKWTLEDEENWYATHRLAGKVWVIGGLAILLCGFLSMEYLFPLLVLAMILLPVLYSWRYSRR